MVSPNIESPALINPLDTFPISPKRCEARKPISRISLSGKIVFRHPTCMIHDAATTAKSAYMPISQQKERKSLQRSIYFVSGRFCPRWQTRKQSISALFQRCKRSKTKNWPRKQPLNGLPCQWEHTAPESVSRRLVRTLAFKVVESRALSADCSAKGRTPLYLKVLGTASQVAQFW